MAEYRNTQNEDEARLPLPNCPPPDPEQSSNWSVKQHFANAKSGSATALGELFNGCRNYLLLIANQAVKYGLQAKVGGSDLVQETFVEAQQIFDRFEGESEEELLRWLTRILEFKIGNTFKRYYGTECRQVGRESDWSQFMHSDLCLSMVAASQSPIKEVQAQEERESFSRAMENLTSEQRTVLKLRIDGRLSFESIGQMTNRSADAARKLFMRAVESLKEDLNPNHDEGNTANGSNFGG